MKLKLPNTRSTNILDIVRKYFPNATCSDANRILNQHTNFLNDSLEEVEEQIVRYKNMLDKKQENEEYQIERMKF